MSAKDIAAKVVRPEVQAMQAYQVSDATGLVKLDVMESPYRLPPGLAAAIRLAFISERRLAR